MLPFRRDYNAMRLNRVINDPSVFAHVATPEQLTSGEALELAPIVNNLDNIALMCDEGGILAHKQELGVYEIHTQFTEKYRGPQAIKTVRDMINWLFINTDAMELLTKIPVNNEAALGLVRAINGKFEFSRENAYALPDDKFCSVDYYALRYNDWLYTPYAAKLCNATGRWFHDKLDDGKALLGVTEASHPDDPAHDLNVGATVEMILASQGTGQVDKGLALYNRWARFAGYAEVRKISQQPLVINIADAVLVINASARDFEVVSCQSAR